jgi:hypothetical protein
MIIDYSKSIDRKQVVTTVTDWGDKLEIGMFYFNNILLLTFLLVVPIYMLVSFYLANDMGAFILILGGAQIIFGFYLIQCLFHWKRLIKIEGVDMATNKELITQIVNGYYPQLNYEWDEAILIGSRPYSNFNFKGGLTVVIMFKDEDIYINILSIYRAGPNPWMALTNVERAKEIGSIFKERIWHWRNDTKRNALDN